MLHDKPHQPAYYIMQEETLYTHTQREIYGKGWREREMNRNRTEEKRRERAAKRDEQTIRMKQNQ